jgi:2,4-dienoyl-CoA reductase-like NADH-dependent reductase (Old Yellow Enzyme family)
MSGPRISPQSVYTPESAAHVVEEQHASFMANPDLVGRIREDLPLNTYHRATYGGAEHGSTDYEACRQPESQHVAI